MTTVPDGAGAGGAAGAVQVGLVLDRRVGVDDEGDVVDVDAAGRDVGGDEGAGRAGVEGVHGAGAGVLAEVAVQLDRGHAGAVELAGQLLGAVLGAGEHDGAAGSGDEVEQHGQVPVGGHVQHVVRHRRDRRLRRVGLVGHRVVQVALDEDADAGVEGRGEQHPLAVRGRGVEEAAHLREEAEVGHVVGLVDDGDLDGVERDVALADEVLEAAGAGDDDVDAAADGRDLRALADAAEDGARGEAEALRRGASWPPRSGRRAHGSGRG